MASPGHEYVLVGFSEEVDRRPLVFVEPLPASKVCSACRLVPKAIALHECGHYFCKPCYEQCLRRGDVVCPLDGEVCLEDEINWMNYKTRNVMTKKVLCWNHQSGCKVVTSAADISRHFHHECRHHLSSCPKCSAEILASDVCTHLESRCDASREPVAAGVQQGTVPQEHEILGATCSDISDGFRQIHNAISMAVSSIEAKLKDQLDEFMQNAYANQQTFHNSFVENNEAFKKILTDTVPSKMDLCELAAQLVAFREAMGDGQGETKAEFDRLALAIDHQYDRMSELLRSTDSSEAKRTRNSRKAAEAHTKSLAEVESKIAWAKNSTPEDHLNALALHPSIVSAATTHTWTIEGYESIKKRAPYESFVTRMGKAMYLRGYSVSVGVMINSFLQAYFLFDLHEGEGDPYLEWPFNLQIRLSILQPEGSERLEYCLTPSRSFLYKYNCLRPQDGRRSGIKVSSVGFSTSHLEARGYIEDDRLLLSLSLEDP